MTRLRHTFFALLILGLLSPAYAASPADTVDTPSPETIVQTELERALTSDRAQAQEQAARRIRAYAHTDRYSRAFFRDLVSPLHDIAADGQTELVRLTAISALSAIGTDAVLRTLKAQVISFEAGPVRRVTVHVIAQHDASWAVAERTKDQR
ncbi:MAG: hypothetical protein ABEK75_11320 [Salinibacter sp.]